MLFIQKDSDQDIKKLELDIYRFEKSLFETDSSNINTHIDIWEDSLGSFFERFNFEIFRIHSDSEEYKTEILRFISHDDMKEAYDTLINVYPDVDFLEIGLEDAFGRYKYFLPDKEAPTILTFFSGFNYGVVSSDTILAIGLDYFLGEKSIFYKRLESPNYLNFQKQKKFILPNCMEVWVNNEFSEYNTGEDFLENMIFKGKLMYLLALIFPDITQADKLRFSNAELEWCNKNEQMIWSYFIRNDILFSKDIKKYRTYVSYSPFAKGMPKVSPGRIAYWLGWKIIDSYMNNMSSVTIEDLMSNTNARQILKESRYKP